MPTQSRQLAAIMFTDIQGYSSLMQKDEDLAIDIRTKHREIFETITKKNNGKILQYYGDGTLSIFTSAVEAVKSGIELQLRFTEEPNIPVRIGIHLGDIVHDHQDIIGDGVNVASRIESMGIPGSVLVSDKINDEIANKGSFSTVSLGKFALKNIAKPKEIFAVNHPGLAVPTSVQMLGKPEKITLARRWVWKMILVIVFALALAFLVNFLINNVFY